MLQIVQLSTQTRNDRRIYMFAILHDQAVPRAAIRGHWQIELRESEGDVTASR